LFHCGGSKRLVLIPRISIITRLKNDAIVQAVGAVEDLGVRVGYAHDLGRAVAGNGVLGHQDNHLEALLVGDRNVVSDFCRPGRF